MAWLRANSTNSGGDVFQILGISLVGDAYTGNLPLLCHGNSIRLGNEGFIRQLAAGDPAAFFYKSDDVLCVSTGVRNVI